MNERKKKIITDYVKTLDPDAAKDMLTSALTHLIDYQMGKAKAINVEIFLLDHFNPDDFNP